MNRPSVVVLSGYAAGLLLGQCFTLPLFTLLLVSLGLLAGAIIFEKLRPWLLWPLLALAGWTNLVLHTAIISPNDLRSLAGQEPAIASIRGTLTAAPRLNLIERNHQETEHSIARVQKVAIYGEVTTQSVIGIPNLTLENVENEFVAKRRELIIDIPPDDGIHIWQILLVKRPNYLVHEKDGERYGKGYVELTSEAKHEFEFILLPDDTWGRLGSYGTPNVF